MNKRSQKIFKKLGFVFKKDLGKEGLYVITQEKFIENIC
jgi:RimJ/RimL family protein N-acetyltransferase